MKARIVIGANYGDEGKGTVVATYTKKSNNVLNVLTNGGAQRGHSILTDDGNITFQHFGSGTYHGADNYYSRFYIMNPIQFVKEYESLIVKPKNIYRDLLCRWSTPYDIMANLISEELKGRHASCGMGIWTTIKRYNQSIQWLPFDRFIRLTTYAKENFLRTIRQYYELRLDIPQHWAVTWNSPILLAHFIDDCNFMYEHTKVYDHELLNYDEVIFENGQGLLLCDTGKDTYDTTPSNTGILYAQQLAREMGIEDDDITAHYVTRPYVTRHGDGDLPHETNRNDIASSVMEDRTNHYNERQGEFRYGLLDIDSLRDRIEKDANGVKYTVEVTHCDEMDRQKEFDALFRNTNFYSSPKV